jgi:hypothetical protein
MNRFLCSSEGVSASTVSQEQNQTMCTLCTLSSNEISPLCVKEINDVSEAKTGQYTHLNHELSDNADDLEARCQLMYFPHRNISVPVEDGVLVTLRHAIHPKARPI